jgi:pimeloyl-ACP methyl ester carboxylesterase
MVSMMMLLPVLHLLAAWAYGQSPPYPPPGKLVDVGGYRVHLYCAGTGKPTVMIVGGGFSFDWTFVQPEVARDTRVCTYDASGTAWSDPGPGRSCPAWTGEVHRLLRQPDLEGPFILVGFSAGAVIARLYATSYPEEVAGLVIVDHAFLPHAPDRPATVHNSSDLDSPPTVLSMTPVFASREDEPGFERLPPRARELDRWASSLNPDLPTAETTEGCIRAAEAAAHGEPHPLGSKPLVVVSTANDTAGYAELQQHLLALSRDSRQLIADKSFHSIEITQSEVVVKAIREVVAAVRNHSHLND